MQNNALLSSSATSATTSSYKIPTINHNGEGIIAVSEFDNETPEQITITKTKKMEVEQTERIEENDGEPSLPFWTEDPNVLFDKSYIMEFYPSSNMTYSQKLNTVSRVVILLSLLLFLYTKNAWVLLVCATTLFFIYLLYDKYKNGEEGYLNPLQTYLALSSPNKNPPLHTIDTDLYQEGTSTNPLSNVLLTDYDQNPDKKTAPPCESNYNQILENVQTLVQEQNPEQPDIGDKLFHSMSDKLDFENSLRPFYSTANTIIPNDQAGFAEFCYGDMFGNTVTCKEGNLFSCARNLSRYTLY